MNLYIIRHAEALPVGGTVRTDEDRILSPRGEEDAKLIGGYLSKLDPDINVLLASPLTRAELTGKRIAKFYGRKLAVHVTKNLAPGFDDNKLLKEIFAQTGFGNAVAVGHMPDVNRFVAFLLAHGSATIEMKPGAVAHLRVDGTAARPDARLASIIHPGMIRLFSDTMS